MSLPLFTADDACKSRIHCKLCRNHFGGREWRESISGLFELPEGKIDFKCPLNLPWNGSVFPRKSTPQFVPPVFDGPAKWREINEFAVKWDGNVKRAQIFMSAFNASISDFGCSCNRHWQEIRAKQQPDLSSVPAFQKWVWWAHNQVNHVLTPPKPEFSWEQAKEMHGFTD